jgi:hypothetical protein
MPVGIELLELNARVWKDAVMARLRPAPVAGCRSQ